MSSLKDMADALVLIEDSTLADSSVTMYRNGARGHLHSRRNCWKAKWDANAVTMPLPKALAQHVCTSCGVDGLKDGDLLVEARRLHHVQLKLNAAQRTLDDPGTPARDLGHALQAALDVRVDAGEYVKTEKLYRAATRLVEQASALEARARAALGGDRVGIVNDIARELQDVIRGRGDRRLLGPDGVPFLTQEQADRFGARRRSQSDTASRLWWAWSEARRESAEAAAAAVRDAFDKHALLTDVGQLAGVSLDATPAGTDATSAVSQAWLARVTADQVLLVEQWEAECARNKADTALTSLAVSKRYAYRFTEQVSGVLRAFDHAETSQALVGTYPALVAYWALAQLGDDVWVLDSPLTADQLATCVTLWEPYSRGAYRMPQAAADAAVRL